MSINLSVPQDEAVELKPRISVVGVGGAGGNAVNNMIAAKLEGVEFIVANTDAQALTYSLTDRRIQLGTGLTQGLGAGSKPEVGRAAAEETIDEINEQLKGSHMVFIAAGMGGGTGTGAAPVIARAARDLGVLTVGVVTKPFQFEGANRQRLANKGIEELEQYVDTLIIIPNQNLFRVANEKTTFSDAFKMADDVLYSGVRGVTDLMVMPGLINLDFADVRSVMSAMGKAMMGTGEASGERRALEAAEAAISNPLLDDTSMAGAQGVLINITGGADMTLFEVDEAANRIRAEVDEDAYIIFGSTFDETLDGRMRVSVVATGIDAEAHVRPQPVMLNMHDDAVARKSTPVEKPVVNEHPIEQPVEHRVAEILRHHVEADGEQDQDPVDDPVMSDDRGDVDDTVELDLGEDAVENAPEDQAKPVISHSTPAAMPSAAEQDAFIPPAPMDTETHELGGLAEAASMSTASLDDDEDIVSQSSSMMTPNIAPVSVAPATSAPTPAAVSAPPKVPNLFERVTGGARNKVSLFGSAKPEAKGGMTSAVAKTTVQEASQPSPQMRSTTMVEPTLGGLEPEQRIQPSQSEEDLLEIPAFLRRQAN